MPDDGSGSRQDDISTGTERTGEGEVKTPDELDFTDKDGIEEIDDGRFVVSPDGTQPSVEKQNESDTVTGDTPSVETGDSPSSNTQLDIEDIKDWNEDTLLQTPASFGYHISLKAGDTVSHTTLYTDDVVVGFERLLLWYAKQLDDEQQLARTIGVLLAEIDTPVVYSPRVLEQYLINQGFSADDSLGDLVSHIRERGGVKF